MTARQQLPLYNLPLPQDKSVSDSSFHSFLHCFDNTTLSYKYYWLMAIVEEVVVNRELHIPAINLALRMISMAWTPVCKHHVGLGHGDGFRTILQELQPILELPIESSKVEVMFRLQAKLADPLVGKLVATQLKKLLNYVPYCFLEPWTGMNYDHLKLVVRDGRGCQALSDTPYWLETKTEGRNRSLWVHVRREWANYLCVNASAIYNYVFYQLYDFVQARNVALLSIDYALDWRIDNETRSRQLLFWDNAIRGAATQGRPLHCLLSGRELHLHRYLIDHYMPSNFRDSERLWSIFPADVTSEVTKMHNHSSDIGSLLAQLSAGQQQAICGYLSAHGSEDFLLAEYGDWGYPIRTLASMPQSEFADLYFKRMTAAYANETNLATGYNSVEPHSTMVADDSHANINITTRDVRLQTAKATIEGDYFQNVNTIINK